ncbi:hypothetical protein ACA910_016479 [Epithemia clementina (nom. ined.)]
MAFLLMLTALPIVVVNGFVIFKQVTLQQQRPTTTTSKTQRFVSSELEPPKPKQDKDDNDNDNNNDNTIQSPLLGRGNLPRTVRITTNTKTGQTSTTLTTTSSSSSSPMITSRQGQEQRQFLVDLSSYEASLIQLWEQEKPSSSSSSYNQKGAFDFDWEIEKVRRYFAGLRQQDDGTWVQETKRAWPVLSQILIQPPAPEPQEPSPPTTFDVARVVIANVLTSISQRPFGGATPVPNAVIQKYEGSFFSFIKGVLGGDLQTLAGGPLFLLLNKYFETYGPIFNLSFGPKSFLVISDPVMAKAVLKSAPTNYCKGMLAEILEPIMGKGLIPADPQTWKVRRRAIAPGFHKKWLNTMMKLFADRADILTDNLLQQIDTNQHKIVNGNSNNNNSNNKEPSVVVDMEERFCSVTLDIIGKAVFNYDFGSVTNESPIVKAVYRVLREAEHRSTSFIPYWNLPYADQWMGGQVEFRKDLTLLNDILANLINQAVLTRQEATIEELEERENKEDPSLLRFLVDMRGEDLSSSVLRDDLMTMLIAGHETTAAMLTWTLFELSRGDPALLHEVQTEVRTVLKDKDRPDYDDLVAMKKLRYALIEALRLYPEPPLLIRRARTDDTLPKGSSRLLEHAGGIQLLRGTDIFISTWNLHRSPDLWENPNQFDPTRWERPFTNAKNVPGWAGYDPHKGSTMGLYPNELASDFAFLPFGGGQRKCVGDQFAVMEATVTLSMVLKHLDFTLAIPAEQVGMKTGATIHTMNGLMMHVKKAKPPTTTHHHQHHHKVEQSSSMDDNDATMTMVNGDHSTTTTTSSSTSMGWWEMQHLKRGLSASGRPFDDVANTNKKNQVGGVPPTNNSDTFSSSSCPM